MDRLFGFLSGKKKRIGENLCNLWLSIFANNGDAPSCGDPERQMFQRLSEQIIRWE
jgi:hypothetical protein